MTTFTIPAPDAPAEEWGRLAVSIPGFRALRGILWRGEDGTPMGDGWNPWPDPDDPATAGCLLALLEPAGPRPYRRPGGLWVVATVPYMETVGIQSLPLGRACIAAAAALGRWPGGAS